MGRGDGNHCHGNQEGGDFSLRFVDHLIVEI